MKKKNILVISGGTSEEHDVSIASGLMVVKNLDAKKFAVRRCVITKKGLWSFDGRKPLNLPKAISYVQRQKYDLVFIALHGPFGEDGKIQSLLEMIGLPYTGSSAVSSAIAMDKDVSNKIGKLFGLAIPQYRVFSHSKNIAWKSFPCVVKPVAQGSSFGTSIVKTRKALLPAARSAFRHDKKILIQQFIRGREITCGVLEKAGKPFVLPPTEVIPVASSFFDYKAKYKVGGSQEITPTRMSKILSKKVQQLSLIAHSMLGCRGMSRSDFILHGNTFYYLETNTIPGLTVTSLLPQQAKAAGISFPRMLDYIIDATLK